MSQERVALSLGQFPIPERRGGYCQRMSFLAGNLRWTLGVGRGRLRGIRSETYSQTAQEQKVLILYLHLLWTLKIAFK